MLALRTDKVKEFVNAAFRNLVDCLGIEMRVCCNPDLKCAFVERFNGTLKSKMYIWFTRNNTHRYFDLLSRFVATTRCTRALDWPFAGNR